MKLDVLAIGTHPDDVELCCGATVAKLVDQGYRVGILHLTRGERGTRGTEVQRRDEARRAAEALGAHEMDLLDCGDGSFRVGEAEEDALIEVLRRWRPEILLAPPERDRHPDHGRAHRLVTAAAFYAGLSRRGEGEPHRPGAVFFYMQHYGFEPSFVVDVTATWQRKVDAMAAYGTQFYSQSSAAEGPQTAEPMTKIASREFALSVEGRARHFGQMVGAELGEAFYSAVPLAVTDLTTLLPSGLR